MQLIGYIDTHTHTHTHSNLPTYFSELRQIKQGDCSQLDDEHVQRCYKQSLNFCFFFFLHKTWIKEFIGEEWGQERKTCRAALTNQMAAAGSIAYIYKKTKREGGKCWK